MDMESLYVTFYRPVCDLKPRDDKVTLKNQEHVIYCICYIL